MVSIFWVIWRQLLLWPICIRLNLFRATLSVVILDFIRMQLLPKSCMSCAAKAMRWFLEVFGLNIKPVLSGRTVEEDLRLGITRCDAVVVTGAGTGLDTPREKIEQFRNTLGDFPLIASAGVTAETVAQTLAVCDGIIVGSWLKEGHDIHGEVSEEYVRQFVAAAKK